MCKGHALNMIPVHDAAAHQSAAGGSAVHGGMARQSPTPWVSSCSSTADRQTAHNNLLDYKLSTRMDHPALQAEFVENFEPTSPFGTKALGEPPACPGAPAIRNAILNATGISINQTPMTPHVLFARFKEEGLL